jgi:hypothetical protein
MLVACLLYMIALLYECERVVGVLFELTTYTAKYISIKLAYRRSEEPKEVLLRHQPHTVHHLPQTEPQY